MAATLVTGLPSAQAGWVEGPYVVWVNLPKTQAVDARIKAFVDADREQCWSDGALLYMRKRPEGVTDELARQAVVERQPQAQARLRQLLDRGVDELPALDGLVVYWQGPQGQPMMGSWSRLKGRVRHASALGAQGQLALSETFCQVLPPISRKP